jgi:hypothetical protein
VRATTGCAGFVGAFGTKGGVGEVVDVFWGYPSAAGWLCTVDSVARGDGPFGCALTVFF